MLKTYCFEVLETLIRDAGCDFKNTHYLADGIQTTLIDSLDRQEYTLILKPKRGVI